ncbi:outer membrane beta-barrel protein [candidate division KSB1 bacterium]
MKSFIKLSSFFIMVLGILLIFPLGEKAVYAQNIQGGLNLLMGMPQEEFKDNIGTRKFGGSIWGGYQFRHSPVLAGLELDYYMYGRTKRTEFFNDYIPEVNVDVSTTYNILTAHTFLRFMLNSNEIIPYFDCLIGFNYLYTRTSVSDDNDISNSIAATTNHDDIAFSYGFGWGCMLSLYNNQNRYNDRKPFAVLLNVRFRYLLGGEAEYLRKGSLTTSGHRILYDVFKSRTDMLTMQIGVNVKFNIR